VFLLMPWLVDSSDIVKCRSAYQRTSIALVDALQAIVQLCRETYAPIVNSQTSDVHMIFLDNPRYALIVGQASSSTEYIHYRKRTRSRRKSAIFLVYSVLTWC